MKTAAFTILGILVGWAFSSFIYNPYESTQHRLVKAQRSIERGGTLTSTIEILGQPTYHCEAGETWPNYGADIPTRLAASHSLSVFYIGRMGQQLLLVVCDSSGKIAYVTSAPT